MKDILLKRVSLDDKPVDIRISGGLISAISPSGESCHTVSESDTDVVDCCGKAVFPGFVNMHIHAGMSMMRGLGEDIAFHKWLERIWDVESRTGVDYIYKATKMSCLEMAKTGTTTFNDHYWHSQVARRAALETGLRTAVSYVICDKLDRELSLRQRQECMEEYEESLGWDEKTQFVVGVHSIYSVLEPTVVWASEFAAAHNLRLHIHLSETEKEVLDCKAAHGGLSPVEYLDSLGVLGPNVIAAHTLWLSDKDMEILGKRHVNCVHNINSNLKLTSGYRFRYNELRDAGANVCIGTDGCASSNNLDMLEAMKTSAIVQKAWRNDPTAMPLDQLLDMATRNGAKALGLDTGAVEVGKIADLILVDTDSYHFMSPAPDLANFIYSAHSDSIDSVICAGKFVMKNRCVEWEKGVLEDAAAVMKESAWI